ncbi:histidinol-phosphatase HisJ [Convivina intestini]|uniref:histidinol-phosphatase HisJ n=1 Tax=Convivina intestini TaxID=1505726 RepID=UPI00200FE752|nr:histidinol-phosphatase HisJ [Convivina intestini]CAH1850650.1 Histidinol-phosphatase [Convivina intestini]
MLKKDGHTHTRYSHHGSQEALSDYLDKAIVLGFDEYVVTEHAPLPTRFLSAFNQPIAARYNSALTKAELPIYKKLVEDAQQQYAQRLLIKKGFEVDYLPGYEEETFKFLKEQANWLDEVILSVHFLPNQAGDLAALDYDALTFEKYFGPDLVDPQALFQRYFTAVLASIELANQANMRVRIGHLTLIRIYQKRFKLPPFSADTLVQIEQVLQAIKAGGHQLDYNAAGFRKPDNGESYPTLAIVRRAIQLGIPLVYGSDAHQVSDLGQHYEEMQNNIKKYLDLYE